MWLDLTQHLTNLTESVQKRALRIVLPSLAYEDALTRSGLENLASRRSNACQMFLEKMKSDDQPNNPIANILRHKIHNEREHSYNLRHEGQNVSLSLLHANIIDVSHCWFLLTILSLS